MGPGGSDSPQVNFYVECVTLRHADVVLVMPGESDRRGWQSPSDQVGDQSSQADWVDGFPGCGQFSVGPPAVASVVLALELI